MNSLSCRKLLDSEDEGIEISYNTCGILSHIGTDGPQAWKISVPQRDVFAAMVKSQHISDFVCCDITCKPEQLQ